MGRDAGPAHGIRQAHPILNPILNFPKPCGVCSAAWVQDSQLAGVRSLVQHAHTRHSDCGCAFDLQYKRLHEWLLLSSVVLPFQKELTKQRELKYNTPVKMK